MIPQATGLIYIPLNKRWSVVPGKMAILGMHQSGKSILLRKLKEKYYDYNQQRNILEKIKAYIRQNEIRFYEYPDPSPSNTFVGQYRWAINRNDNVVFMFNLHTYLNQAEYANKVHARLELIHNLTKKKLWEYLNINARPDGKPTFIIATHADQIAPNDLEKLKKTIAQNNANKSFSRLLQKNFFLLDTRNDEETKHLLEVLYPAFLRIHPYIMT